MEVLRQEILEFGKSIEPAYKYFKSLPLVQVSQPTSSLLEEFVDYEVHIYPNKVIANHKTINLTITDYGTTAHIITNTLNEILGSSSNKTWTKLSNDELSAINDFIFTLHGDPGWRKNMPVYDKVTGTITKRSYLSFGIDTITKRSHNIEPYLSFDIDIHGFEGLGKTSMYLFKALKSKMVSLTQQDSESTVINSKAISTYDGKFQHSLTIRADGSWSVKYADEYTGPLVGYKKTTGRSGELVICVLHIPESSRLDTGDNVKFRAEEVYVYDMFEPGYSPCAVCKKKTYLYEKPKYSQVQDFAIMSDPNFTFKCKDHINHTLASFVPVKQVDSSHSPLYSSSYIYTVKTVAKPANGSFTSRRVSCGVGIHFCISPVTLVDYLKLG